MYIERFPVRARDIEYLLAKIAHPVEKGTATGQQHTGAQRKVRTTLIDVVLDQHQDLLHTGVDDGVERHRPHHLTRESLLRGD